jgi:hypothetical protein
MSSNTPPSITYPPVQAPGVEISNVDVNIRQVAASITAVPMSGSVPFEAEFDCTGSSGQRAVFFIAEEEYAVRTDAPETGWVFNYTFLNEGPKTATITVFAGNSSATQSLLITAAPSPPEGDDGIENTYVIRIQSFGVLPGSSSDIGLNGETV